MTSESASPTEPAERAIVLEQGLRARHEKSGRHPFARDVTDEKRNPSIVHEVVVVEVATDLARGDERGGKLETLAVAAEPALGQHVHLDVVRNLELALKFLLRRGRLLEITDVGLERVAHVAEGLRQRSDFVVGARGG